MIDFSDNVFNKSFLLHNVAMLKTDVKLCARKTLLLLRFLFLKSIGIFVEISACGRRTVAHSSTVLPLNLSLRFLLYDCNR